MNARIIAIHGLRAGGGADSGKSIQSGTPTEAGLPHRADGARQREPGRLHDRANPAKAKATGSLVPIKGATILPRGVSGVMRKMAFEIPADRLSRRFVLLLAGGVDVVEHRFKRLFPYVLPLVVGGMALFAMKPRHA
jgi:hypothetical protein